MKLLLDSHALIWFVEADKQFSEKARNALAQQEEGIFVSVVTIWEIAIKQGLGKLRLGLGLEDGLREFLEENGFQLLEINYAHAARVASLPLKHKDPFDRLLVAQTLIENMILVSHDPIMDAYNVKRLW